VGDGGEVAVGVAAPGLASASGALAGLVVAVAVSGTTVADTVAAGVGVGFGSPEHETIDPVAAASAIRRTAARK